MIEPDIALLYSFERFRDLYNKYNNKTSIITDTEIKNIVIPEEAIIIYIGEVSKLINPPDIYLSTEPLKKEIKYIEKLDCLKLLTFNFYKSISNWDQVVFFRLNKYEYFYNHPYYGYFQSENNSIVAIQWAYYLGFSKIILYGNIKDSKDYNLFFKKFRDTGKIIINSTVNDIANINKINFEKALLYPLKKNKQNIIDFKKYKEKKLLSVIISLYNADNFIYGCIEDLVSQTVFDNIEIIIIDSNSPGNEKKVIQEFLDKYSNIRYFRTNKRETIYKAWNRAILLSKGKYISNSNVDDRHREDYFEKMIAFLELNNDFDLVYSDRFVTGWTWFVANNPEFKDFFSHLNYSHFQSEEDINLNYSSSPTGWEGKPFSFKELRVTCLPGPQPVWRKSLHDKYGLFLENIRVAGDYEFWLRISPPVKMERIPEPLGLYYARSQSLERIEFGKVVKNETEYLLKNDKFFDFNFSENHNISICLIYSNSNKSKITLDILKNHFIDKFELICDIDGDFYERLKYCYKKANNDYLLFIRAGDIPDINLIKYLINNKISDIVYCDKAILENNIPTGEFRQYKTYNKNTKFIIDSLKEGKLSFTFFPMMINKKTASHLFSGNTLKELLEKLCFYELVCIKKPLYGFNRNSKRIEEEEIFSSLKENFFNFLPSEVFPRMKLEQFDEKKRYILYYRRLFSIFLSRTKAGENNFLKNYCYLHEIIEEILKKVKKIDISEYNSLISRYERK